MSKVVNNLHTIYNNPFLFTPLILEFYRNYPGSDNDCLLSYLIFPLVLHESTRNTLKTATVRSSLRTFFRNKENYYAIPNRIDEYKELTNICIQNGIDTKSLELKENMSIEFVGEEVVGPPFLSDSMRAARNLVKIIKNVDVVTVYRTVGAKSL
jgi:hypothetical protein